MKCSYKTRIIGFIVCCAIGWFLSILGTITLFIKHDVTQFAILFSIGQILNITGYHFINVVHVSWQLHRNKLKAW